MLSTQVLVPLRAITMIAIKLSAEGKERRDRLLETGCCLGCERVLSEDEKTRCGQCGTCYSASRAKINSGQVRLQDLIRDGKMLSPKPGGRPPKNKYTRELSDN